MYRSLFHSKQLAKLVHGADQESFQKDCQQRVLPLTTVANCSYKIVDYIELIGGRTVTASD